MKTLLSLLAAVALLVWGTHIVRTGLLRVYGANLRRVLGHSVRNRLRLRRCGSAADKSANDPVGNVT